MKRLFSVLLVLMLLCASTSAESLFPALSTPTPAPGEIAPSYGGFANVNPDQVEPYAEGGSVVTYSGVTEENYYAFGEYLAGLGFELVQSNVNGRSVEMMLSNGSFNIGIVYDADTQILIMIFEKDVEFARKDNFPGYTRASLGETVKIKNLGEFTINEFHLKNYALHMALGTLSDGSLYGKQADVSTVFLFQFLNTTNQPLDYGRRMTGMVSVSLVYINEDGVYSFPSEYCGAILEKKGEPWLICEGKPAGQMERQLYGASFDLPESVLNAENGTLALTLEFATGENAVVYLRENGARAGDWE